MQPYVRTTKNGKPIDQHRKVMEEYLGRKLSRNEQVHHINGDKHDNRIENLVVLSPAEHMKLHKQIYPTVKVCKVCGKEFEPHKTKRKRAVVCSNECKIKLDGINANKRKKPIVQLNKDGTVIKAWESLTDIRKALGFAEGNIVKCCKGIIKSAYGCKWEYAKEQ